MREGDGDMTKKLSRVVFTCGGTAGHVNPAIAIAERIAQETPEAEFLFIGAERGLERELIEHAGYPFASVHSSNFHRSLAPKELRHNLVSAVNVVRGPREAKKLLRDFGPQIVVGTGGYASYSAVSAAASLKIPTAVHESNIVPGLTTRMLENEADRLMVGFEACRAHYRHKDKVVVTGTPVREGFFNMTKAEARASLGIPEDKPLVVSFWGSLGASGMNRSMEQMLIREAHAGQPFVHVHGAGHASYPGMLRALIDGDADPEQHPDLWLLDYIYDMPRVMRAADLVICRAGASTISELTALGVAALIVPSPYVTNDHQKKNADALAAIGGALVLEEKNATGDALYEAAASILHQVGRREKMERAMAGIGVRDASERIMKVLHELTDTV